MDANAIVENFRRIVTTQYFDFEGRARRQVFWYYALAYFVLFIAVSFVESILFGGPTYYGYGYGYFHPRPLSGLFELALLLPSLGIAARRLHDIGRSAWWLLLTCIPVLGWLVLIYWYAQPGTTGANQFGPDPKAVITTPPPA
jgi:uncharacterized membrane protein YhaH (DUF805 family)